MTLVIAVHNEKDIVIGSDSLATVKKDGKQLPNTLGMEKIYTVNKKTVIGVSGMLSGETVQFIRGFCYAHKDEQNVATLRDMLLIDSEQILTLQSVEKIDFCLCGYVDEKPTIKIVKMRPGEKSQSLMPSHQYHVIGYDRPGNEAVKILASNAVDNNMSTRDMKELVVATLNDLIEKYKDDEEQPLGGKPVIKVLHLK